MVRRERSQGIAAVAPDGAMETAKNFRLSGRHMTDLWREFESRFRPPLTPP